MTAIASLISAIMLGSFEAFIPGFNPISYLYALLFGESIPEYLLHGFYAMGYFSLLYSLIGILVIPVACNIGFSARGFNFETPSKEDFVFFPILYLVYLYVIYTRGLLTLESAVVGICAVTLPVVYRLLVYFVSSRFSSIKESCYFNLYVFLVSIMLSIPVTVIYLLAIKCLIAVI